jgi:5-methyltetrahydropteroyltriglutamate--homocysteine methyltransferase
MSLPLFPVTTVGSWPRPKSVAEATRAWRQRRIDRAGRDRVVDAAVVEFLQLQERLGCDILTDGELRRDNFYSFVADKLSGVRLLTLAEMLEVVEDKAGFEQLLQTLDVPAYSISSPICTGRIQRREPLAVDDLMFARRHTDLPIKVTLPGPYLLTRAMFVPELTRACYPDKEALARDVVVLLRTELEELRAAGADFVQFDEPVLTEVAFAPGRTRTFMCAALAARSDPAEELEFAVSLINQVVAGVDDLRLGLHVCRGNWSRDESTLLSGGYQALRPYLDRLRVTQLVLEYATDRAGALVAFADKEVGLGVVNPRTEEVEAREQIRRSVQSALDLYPADRVFLNPDCGFGTFANRPMNTCEIAAAKIAAMAAAARDLRGG